jgi:short-subunit dehydrogenase
VLDRVREATDDIEVGLLIYNAGDAAGVVRFLDRPLDNALHAMKLNALTPTMLTHHFAGKMRPRGRGGILIVGSLAGNAGVTNLAVYCGAKAYSQMFCEAMWAELRPHGIDVLSFIVGATDTPGRARANTTEPEGMPVLSSEEVAKQALDDLDNGPVQVPKPLVPIFEAMYTPQRRMLVEASADTVKPRN